MKCTACTHLYKELKIETTNSSTEGEKEGGDFAETLLPGLLYELRAKVFQHIANKRRPSAGK